MKRALNGKGVFVGILILLSAMFPTHVVGAAGWWENVKVKGNLRYRHEMINKEDKNVRHRDRIRARVGIFTKANEKIDIGIQLATGSDDPASTNQTLDGAFSTKNIGIDLAYFEYKPSKLKGLKVVGGKFKNQFFKPGKSELIWDGDLNLEGSAVTFNHNSDNFGLTLIGSGLWIEERSSSDDSYLLSGQSIAKLHFNEGKTNIAFGGGFFNYVNALGFQPFYDDEEPMGNSIVVDSNNYAYANDFKLIELFTEATHRFNNIPATIMFDYVTNSGADSLNTGWLVGLRVGKAKKIGSWEFRYNYRELEKDAVIGTFSDSDFRGGGTNGKGHEIGGAYQLLKNTAFKSTYFINEIGIDKNNTEDFKRLQVDLQLKF